MRVILDTNVLIAAFVSHGACHELLEHCVIFHTVVLSPFIMKELSAKLHGKFEFSATEAASVIKLLKTRVEMIPDTKPAKNICRDPDDDFIIEAAVTGQCDCIITGDKDLLILKKARGIPIIGPSAFWEFESGSHEHRVLKMNRL